MSQSSTDLQNVPLKEALTKEDEGVHEPVLQKVPLNEALT
jgi:hypothetical protein